MLRPPCLPPPPSHKTDGYNKNTTPHTPHLKTKRTKPTPTSKQAQQKKHTHANNRTPARPQLRTGDITLYGAEKGGVAFFERLKAQLDVVLAHTFPVHWYFFAEAAGTPSAQKDYDDKEEEEEVGGWVSVEWNRYRARAWPMLDVLF